MIRKSLKEEKAITLVALIITIIVLLILAMVSISLVMNGGIIDRAERGTKAYTEAEIEEQIKLAYAEWQTAQFTSDAGDAATFMQTRLRTTLKDNGLTVTGSFKITLSNGKEFFYSAKSGQMADSEVDLYPTATASTSNQPVSENSKYTSNGKTAVIPAGYSISNVEAEQSIDTGLVITKGGNEWVWIPVANVTDLYTENTTNSEWILCGTSGDNKVVSKYASKARTDVRSDLTRTTPGTTSNSSYREPDVLTMYDNTSTNWTEAGFNSYKNMAESLKNDYKNMIDSIKRYGGFYVGRYELSEEGTKKDQPPLTMTSWYNLYAKCKTFGEESTTYSRMIWGCQWDQVCKFIETAKDANGDTISLSDSTKYGNYKNSQAPANAGNYQSNKKKNTGSNEAWKTNNIYDLAGNCYEWTQEACSDGSRVYRGGCYYDGSDYSVTYRYQDNPTANYYSHISSRPTLYIK